MDSCIGQKGRYLYKQAGDEFTVDAEIVNVNGVRIEVRFMHPSGLYQYSRWLRTAQDRARFTTDLSYEVKRRGATSGNQNARKSPLDRIITTISLSGTRLEKISTALHQRGVPLDEKSAKHFILEMVDEYLNRISTTP